MHMIEVDPIKVKKNLADHSIHLTEAETVLHDPSALTQEDDTADGSNDVFLLLVWMQGVEYSRLSIHGAVTTFG